MFGGRNIHCLCSILGGQFYETHNISRDLSFSPLTSIMDSGPPIDVFEYY